MRQLINDYFYPLSRVEEYTHRLSIVVLGLLCIVFSGTAWFCALAWPFNLKPAATCYAASALCLVALNFRLGVLLGEQENPPLS